MDNGLVGIASWAPKSFMVLAQSWIASMDGEVEFWKDEWDIIEWKARPGNRRCLPLRFSSITNQDFRLIAKCYIAAKRIEVRISSSGADAIVYSLRRLSLILGDKEFRLVNADDFGLVERDFLGRGVTGKISLLSNLQGFSTWIQTRLGLRVLYSAPRGKPSYGREGTERGRQTKLLPTEIFRDLFKLATRPELDLRDRFFLNALVLNTALGCRINELACLPFDCLVEQDGKWVIKYFPEKGGRLFFRPIPQDMYPSVKAALDFIGEHTAEGRSMIRRLKLKPAVDWVKVRRSPTALKYYAQKFAADWVSEFSLFTPKGSYYRTSGQFVDALGLLKRFGTACSAAEFLGTSTRCFNKLANCQAALQDKIFLYEKSHRELSPLNCDVKNWKRKLRLHPHAIQISSLEESWQIDLTSSRSLREVVDSVLDQALLCQLTDQAFPFAPDLELEAEFARVIVPTIRGEKGAILSPEDSLFVVPRNILAVKTATRTNQYSMVSDTTFSGWLATSSSSNNSLFRRFNIIDPRTGKVAEFVWHDIRHWLNTVYKQGGLSDVQVNLILGRSDLAQARVYDHTPALSRSKILQAMMQRVRDGLAVGVVQTTFNQLKIESREIAEEYLTAAVRVINPMPHGGCSYNLALKTCQHSLSCFAQGSNGQPCGDLIVDVHNPEQRREITVISRDAKTMQAHISASGGEHSQQYKHFVNVQRSADYILQKISDFDDDRG
jgi:hypothetical protein